MIIYHADPIDLHFLIHVFYENLNANGIKKKKKAKAKNKNKKASSKTKKKKTEDAEDDEPGAVDGVESGKSDEETDKDEACALHIPYCTFTALTRFDCVPSDFTFHSKMSLFLVTITSHPAWPSVSFWLMVDPIKNN